MYLQKHHKIYFSCLGVFALFHLARDIFQQLRFENFTTAILHLEKNWCGAYCNAITVPFELFILLGSMVVLRRNKAGLLGKIISLILVIWVGMFWYDWFVFN